MATRLLSLLMNREVLFAILLPGIQLLQWNKIRCLEINTPLGQWLNHSRGHTKLTGVVTEFTIRFEILDKVSAGIRYQSAVMPSVLLTARIPSKFS